MSENILDYFGKILMLNVRDRTISNFDRMIDGKMKGITAKCVSEKISSFNDNQLETLKWLIPKIVDLSLHNMLVMIEENNEINVEVFNGNNANSLKEVSDGLAGELYTEDGWILKYSKERYDGI